MFLFIYQICFFCLIPVFFLNLLIKGAKQKLYLSKISNRIGLGFKKRNNPILIHAVSLGEVLGIKNFVKTLKEITKLLLAFPPLDCKKLKSYMAINIKLYFCLGIFLFLLIFFSLFRYKTDPLI